LIHVYVDNASRESILCVVDTRVCG
jgi:hypothetical protein